MLNSTLRRPFVETVRSVSSWRHSAHTVQIGRKGFVVTSALRRLTPLLWGEELDILCSCPPSIPPYLFVCFVLFCYYWLHSFTSCRLCHVWFRWPDRCWGENHQHQTQNQQQCGKIFDVTFIILFVPWSYFNFPTSLANELRAALLKLDKFYKDI